MQRCIRLTFLVTSSILVCHILLGWLVQPETWRRNFLCRIIKCHPHIKKKAIHFFMVCLVWIYKNPHDINVCQILIQWFNSASSKSSLVDYYKVFGSYFDACINIYFTKSYKFLSNDHLFDFCRMQCKNISSRFRGIKACRTMSSDFRKTRNNLSGFTEIPTELHEIRFRCWWYIITNKVCHLGTSHEHAYSSALHSQFPSRFINRWTPNHLIFLYL